MKRTRASRVTMHVRPQVMDTFRGDQGLWYESPEDIRREMADEAERARLIRWVRAEMGRRLTAAERQCVELYYFQGRNYREAAKVRGTNPAVVHRAVRRALRKLRAAAQENAEELAPLRSRRRRDSARREPPA